MDEKYIQSLIKVMQTRIAELTTRNLQIEAKLLSMTEETVTVRDEEREASEFDKPNESN